MSSPPPGDVRPVRRGLFFHVAFVSAAYYLNNALYMVRGLFLARILGPSVFGVWSAMRLTQTLAANSHLGTRHGVIQLAPQAMGANDLHRAEELRRAASGFQLLSATALLLVVAVGGLFAGPWRTEWLSFGLALFAVQIFSFYHAVARSLQRFTLSASGEMAVAVVSSIVGVLAAWRFGLLGFVIAVVAAYLFGLTVMVIRGPRYPRPGLSSATVRRLLSEGFPLMASGGLFTLLWNTDKLLLWLFRSSEALGVYAVQASFTTVALLAPTALSTVLHPYLLHRVGESGSSDTLRPYLLRGGVLLAAWSAPIAAAGHVLLHLPIRWLVPEYVEAIGPGRVLMIATYFSMAATVPMVVVAAASGQRKLCLIRIGAIAVALTGGLMAIDRDFAWLAVAVGLGFAVDGVWTALEALMRLEVDRRRAASFAVRFSVPFFLLIVGIGIAWVLVPHQDVQDLRWQADLAASGLRTAIALAPSAAWAAWLTHRLASSRASG